MPQDKQEQSTSSEKVDVGEILKIIAKQNQQVINLLGALQPGKSTLTSRPIHVNIEKYDETVETYDDYIGRLEAFFKTQLLPESARADTFITLLSPKHHALLKNLLYPADLSTKTYEELKSELKKHLNPTPLVIPSRHTFLNRKQLEGESVTQFLSELRKLAANCKYSTTPQQGSTQGTMLDTMLRDVFVSGLRSRVMLDRLFEEDDPNLKKVVEIAQAIEKASEGTSEILHPLSAVHKVIKHSNNNQPHTSLNSSKMICFKCGAKNSHKANLCRATNLYCKFCRTSTHVESVCMKKRRLAMIKLLQSMPDGEGGGEKEDFSVNDQVDYLSHEVDPDSPFHSVPQSIDAEADQLLHDLFNTNLDAIYKITTNREKNYPPLMVSLSINDHQMQLELDTGSRNTILNFSTLLKIAPTADIQPTNTILKAFNGTTIQPKGVVDLTVTYNHITKRLEAIIVEEDYPLVLGRAWMSALNIKLQQLHFIGAADKKQRINSMLSKYTSVFGNEVGLIRNYKCDIKLKDNACPIFRKPRPVPLSLRAGIERELDRLVENGVLRGVSTSEWATPIVPVVKPSGEIRICADYSSTLNQHIQVTQHPFPGYEDVFSTLSSGSKFSTLDVRSAFLHMAVTSDTAKLLTITTHRGLFEPQRLMYGVSTAPAEWQKYVDALFRAHNCYVVHDDIIVTGKTDEEHLTNLEAVLETCLQNGIHLNHEKCKFFETSVNFLGYRVDAKGVHKTTSKVNAILNTPQPKSVKDVKSFLGLVTFYSKFVPHLSTLAQPLHALTCKNVDFRWDQDCEHSFTEIKQEIASDRVLVHYDPTLPLSLATDASPWGVGAVLSHVINKREYPIAFASRMLSKSEKSYSMIDKEALAIKWAMFKFFHYIYGRHFVLITDHKPLIHIFGSKQKLPLLSATRMLHYALQLQIFNFDVRYRKSSEHGNADALSRLPQNSDEWKKYEADDEASMFMLMQYDPLPVSAREVAAATVQDSQLKVIYSNLLEGVSQGDKDGKLSLHHGCIFHGVRVYIPSALRKQVLNELHSGHLGVVKMKNLARSYVYWPNIDADIEYLTKSCPECNIYAKNPVRITNHHWEPTKHPWERIHIDFAGPFHNKTYLLVVDSYSKWPEIIMVNSMSSHSTILYLADLFTRYGAPKVVVSDNGPSFTSRDFQVFLKQNGIHHKTCAPFNPSTNGQVERLVQTMKQALRKLLSSPGSIQEKLNKFLLAYRRAPHSSTGVSPARLMLGREIRSALDLLKPRLDHSPDPATTDLPVNPVVFLQGEKVAVRSYLSPTRKWDFGRVINRDGDLHYSVEVGNSIWRRHVNQMRKIGQDLQIRTTPTSEAYQPSVTQSQQDATTHHDSQPTPPSGSTHSFVPSVEVSQTSPSSLSSPGLPSPKPNQPTEGGLSTSMPRIDRNSTKQEDLSSLRRSRRLRQAPKRLIDTYPL